MSVLAQRNLGDNVRWYVIATTDEFSWPASALQQLPIGFDVSFGGGKVEVTQDSGGIGWALDARAAMMSPADLACRPAEISYGRYIDSLVRHFMRPSATPESSDVSVVGSGADITFDDSGAIPAAAQKLYGATTGAIITSSALFGDINTYQSATANGAAGLMLWASGTDLDADNAFPRRILWCDDSNIVLDPAYVSGSTGNFGAPLADETPTNAVTLKVGRGPKMGAGSDAVAYNFEADLVQQGSGNNHFREFIGQKPVSFGLTMDGQGYVRLVVGYQGLKGAAAYSSSKGTGSATAPVGLDTAAMAGDNGLEYAVALGSTVLQAAGLVSFQINGQAEVASVDDEAGSRQRRGVDVGDYAITGSVVMYDTPDVAAALDNLPLAGDEGPIDFFFEDAAGNRIVVGCPRVVSADAFTNPQAGTTYSNITLNFTAVGKGTDIPPFVWQELSA